MILQRMRFEIPRTVFSLFDATHTISLQSLIVCSNCGHKSITTGPMEHGLSIPISPPVTGMALPLFIQNYLKEEIQGYRCEECRRIGRVIRNQTIAHAPDVLTFQLKRFNWDPRTGKKSKNNAKVQIPESLNMGKHTVGEEPVIYRLRSTVCHSGNLGSGHYICFASGPDQRWKCFDDFNVSPASFSAAVNHSRGMTPYLLFYERVLAPQRQ
jgi:ubiquitin C-terminal hydrolase